MGFTSLELRERGEQGMEMQEPATVGSVYRHCTGYPGRDVEGGGTGPRTGPWAHQHGELMEGKSQCRRLTGHIQGKQGKPGWCGISEAEREGQLTTVTAVRGCGDA